MTKLFVPDGAELHLISGETPEPSDVYSLGILPLLEKAGLVTLSCIAFPPECAIVNVVAASMTAEAAISIVFRMYDILSKLDMLRGR
jgi:hypothetical protein